VLPTTSLTVSSLGERVGARTLSTAGMLSISISTGLVGLSWLGPDASTTAIVCPLVLLGVGGGLFFPPNNSATLNTIPLEHLSVANGFHSMARA
jgi:MFS family permease